MGYTPLLPFKILKILDSDIHLAPKFSDKGLRLVSQERVKRQTDGKYKKDVRKYSRPVQNIQYLIIQVPEREKDKIYGVESSVK